MPILPIFNFYNPNSAETHILDLIQYIQEPESTVCLGIRTSLDLLSSLDDAVQQQLVPFISSGRIHIFPDSFDAAFQGLMNMAGTCGST